ncbi:DUF3037 domain-containing protein [Luteimonas sp. BDR2-5]|uniref:DUF3037 domain-containing protein n=1 Tax=Proluteimonas luteida TaxID=2878685 RepID=UPI001E457B4A|nr:DUF3037 domain-containing protein [Luteimonas sp. BDR2-5]MCD9027231.1 DUF3037 domain-containing protein [Luteimonas sp. BDR2-5]
MPVVYDYAVIRAVPRVEREEFVNVGVIVSCQAPRMLAAGIALDPARVRALDPHVDIDVLQRHLDAIVRICRGDADGGPIAALPPRARFHWLTAKRSSVIQVSPVHTGRSADPEGVLERLMWRMVLPPGPPANPLRA